VRLPIKAQIRTYKNVFCKVRSAAYIIKCAKVRARFARAEQL